MRESIILLVCACLFGMAAVGTAVAAPLLIDTGYSAYDVYMCDSDAECEEATGYPFDVAMEDDPPKYPRLVGLDCEGSKTGAPIYAFEEDHFPTPCREIRAMDWDWQDGP